MSKTYPDHTFENAARKTGARVCVLWEHRGPKDTLITWMTGYQVGSGFAIVLTYTGGGWDVLTGHGRNDGPLSIADALARCGVPELQDA